MGVCNVLLTACEVVLQSLLFRPQKQPSRGGFSSGHRWGILGGHPGLTLSFVKLNISSLNVVFLIFPIHITFRFVIIKKWKTKRVAGIVFGEPSK
jgi:hypothetical protein